MGEPSRETTPSWQSHRQQNSIIAPAHAAAVLESGNIAQAAVEIRSSARNPCQQIPFMCREERRQHAYIDPQTGGFTANAEYRIAMQRSPAVAGACNANDNNCRSFIEKHAVIRHFRPLAMVTDKVPVNALSKHAPGTVSLSATAFPAVAVEIDKVDRLARMSFMNQAFATGLPSAGSRLTPADCTLHRTPPPISPFSPVSYPATPTACNCFTASNGAVSLAAYF